MASSHKTNDISWVPFSSEVSWRLDTDREMIDMQHIRHKWLVHFHCGAAGSEGRIWSAEFIAPLSPGSRYREPLWLPSNLTDNKSIHQPSHGWPRSHADSYMQETETDVFEGWSDKNEKNSDHIDALKEKIFNTSTHLQWEMICRDRTSCGFVLHSCHSVNVLELSHTNFSCALIDCIY